MPLTGFAAASERNVVFVRQNLGKTFIVRRILQKFQVCGNHADRSASELFDNLILPAWINLDNLLFCQPVHGLSVGETALFQSFPQDGGQDERRSILDTAIALTNGACIGEVNIA